MAKQNSLIALAKLRGMSLADVAIAAELSLAVVQRAARGEAVRPASADAIARALGATSRQISHLLVVSERGRSE